MKSLRTIGIFDSGLGGLTVLKEIMKKYMNLNIIYFGDNIRVPYYTQPREVISGYSLQISNFLVQKGAELVIIACNTATIASLKDLCTYHAVPVIGIVNAGIRLAVEKTRNFRIGIWGTEYTVKSKAFETGIKLLIPEAVIFSEACPELSLLIEGNKIYSEEMEYAIKKHLSPFKNTGIDTLVLGCTHYPIIHDFIKQYACEQISIVNPAEQISLDLQSLIHCDEREIFQREECGSVKCFTTGNKSFFEDHFRRIMGFECIVDTIRVGDLQQYAG